MKNNVINFERSNLKGTKTPDEPDDLLSIREFCEKRKMKKGTLYKLMERGLIPRHKRGVWKISESEALRYLDGELKNIKDFALREFASKIRRGLIPACPHCKEPFDLEKLKDVVWMSKEYAELRHQQKLLKKNEVDRGRDK